MIRLQGVPNEIRQAILDLNKRLGQLENGNLDLRGRRVSGGRGLRGSDFVTRRQLESAVPSRGVLEGPWRKNGPLIHPIVLDDRVGIGLAALPTATVRLHIRSAAVAAFPTIGAQDFVVLEGSGSINMSFVGGATANMAIKFFGSGDAADDGIIQYNRNTRQLTFGVATVNRVRITSAGSLLCQLAGALATTATDGFLYIPSCAGAPTGVPTAQTGMIPVVYDSTNHVLYAYSGGAWRTH